MKKKKGEKRLLADIKIFLKKKKSLSIVVNVIRIFLSEYKGKASGVYEKLLCST